jgi:hypothetical protein
MLSKWFFMFIGIILVWWIIYDIIVGYAWFKILFGAYMFLNTVFSSKVVDFFIFADIAYIGIKSRLPIKIPMKERIASLIRCVSGLEEENKELKRALARVVETRLQRVLANKELIETKQVVV